MSFNRRLDVLQQKLVVEVVDGWCSKCLNRHIKLRFDESIPPTCAICGKIARSIVYISNPKELCAAPAEIVRCCKAIIVLPDNGRDSRQPSF